MEKRKSFAFVAHWVEPWNWLLWYVRGLHKNPQYHWLLIPFAPVYWFMSFAYLWGSRSFDVVDEFFFNDALQGKTILIRNFAWHFFLPRQKKKIKKRILQAVLEAQKTCDVIGLGALTKAEWLTEGGKWIVDYLGDQLKVPVVHGDTLTAAVVIEKVLRLIRQFKIKTPVFITGATSKIGRAVILGLAQRGVSIVMYTKSSKRFKAIHSEAGEFGHLLCQAVSLEEGMTCSFWITGKAIPRGKDLLPFIPREAVVLNFSVPNPFAIWGIRRRPDIILVEGGLLAYDSTRTSLQFTMRLRPGLTYACHAGTMVHLYNGWTHHEVGSVDMSQIPVVWQAAVDLGFSLP